jgi:colicin import membrane protein
VWQLEPPPINLHQFYKDQMPYVPNLIPDHSKVNIDFSKKYDVKKDETKKTNQKLVKWIYWILLIFGFFNLFTRFWFALPFCLVGLLLIPSVKNSIEKNFAFKFTPKLQLIFYSSLIFIGSLFFPGYKANEEKVAALEKAEKDNIAIQEKRKVEAENKRIEIEQTFLKHYPFIKADEYQEWIAIAKDSITNHQLKASNFIHDRKIEFVKHERDSIKLAKEEANRLRREERRQQRIYEAENTYNGHVIYTGPRGGRYYINSNGNKTYVPR